MEKQFFSLEHADSNKITRLFQIIFGVICLIVAIGWLYLSFTSITPNGATWVTILFLMGFSWFQIRTGLGQTVRFIEISEKCVTFRKNSFLPQKSLDASDLDRIEIFPLSLVFITGKGSTNIIRFGTTYTDQIDPIKESIELFAEANNIPVEVKTEEI